MPRRDTDGQGKAPESTLVVAGATYLLVESGGFRVHLAARHGDAGPGSAAAPSSRSGPFHEPEVLTGWLPTTLCGREWQHAVTEADEAWAPDCRTCLRLVDRHLPSRKPDERNSSLAQLVGAAVVEYGSAEVLGVPGDQLTAFRAAVRAELKTRGFRSKTFVEGELLLIVSDGARQAMSEAARRRQQLMVAEAIQKIGLGYDGPRIDTSGWTFRWSDWTSWT